MEGESYSRVFFTKWADAYPNVLCSALTSCYTDAFVSQKAIA